MCGSEKFGTSVKIKECKKKKKSISLQWKQDGLWYESLCKTIKIKSAVIWPGMEPRFYNLSCIKVIMYTVSWRETLCWVSFHQIRVHLFCRGLHGETPLLVLQVCWWPSGLWLTEVSVCLQANRHLKRVNVPVERRKPVTIRIEKNKNNTHAVISIQHRKSHYRRITECKNQWKELQKKRRKTDGDKLTLTFSLLKQQKGQFSSNDQSDTVVGSRSRDEHRVTHWLIQTKSSSNDLFFLIRSIISRPNVPKSLCLEPAALHFSPNWKEWRAPLKALDSEGAGHYPNQEYIHWVKLNLQQPLGVSCHRCHRGRSHSTASHCNSNESRITHTLQSHQRAAL